MFKINVEDRNYTKYSVFNFHTLFRLTSDTIKDPFENKLFNNDVICKCDNGEITLHHSMIRSMKYIPGILVLNNNKTFGKEKNKYYYQCIPDDKRLPMFLIPYEVKDIGFIKYVSNKYIVFRFDKWEDKFPMGKIEITLGDVSHDINFYEYELYCKSLYASISNFTKETKNKMKKSNVDSCLENIKSKIEYIDLLHEHVFTIDSKETTDYDDALSIIDLGNEEYMLKIHIANVTIWLDELALWDSFSNRISSIYLPDRKRPMIPTILSEKICSLNSEMEKIVFTIEIHIQKNEVFKCKYYNSLIKVRRNFVYEEKDLLKNKDYILIKHVFEKLYSNKLNDYKFLSKIKNSFDVVAYSMILVNYFTAIKMADLNKGIFKSASIDNYVTIPHKIDEEMENFIKMWNNSVTQYCLFSKKKSHEFLRLDSYIHITSPIRRLVDLLNLSIIQEELQLIKPNENRSLFLEKWSESLEYINTTMRAIKKVQRNCNLLNKCIHNSEILEKEYSCFIFDKLVRNDDLIQYMIYNKELESVAKITTSENLFSYRYYKFKIFVFEDEGNLKKKIRYQLVDNNIIC